MGRTTLIIAHRLSTIRNADLIVGFDNGIVKEMGTHDELIELKGIYHQLVTSQTKDSNKIKNDDHLVGQRPVINDDDEEPISSDSDEDEDEDENEENEKKIEKNVQDRKLSKQTENLKENDNKLNLKPKSESVSSIAKKKKKTKFFKRKLFKYERKLLKIQRPDMFWIVLGSISQAINGAIFPGIALLFSEVYALFAECDYAAQLNESLQWMGVIMGLGAGTMIVVISLNYSFALAGSRLTTKLRVLMFKSMLRQEVFDLIFFY